METKHVPSPWFRALPQGYTHSQPARVLRAELPGLGQIRVSGTTHGMRVDIDHPVDPRAVATVISRVYGDYPICGGTTENGMALQWEYPDAPGAPLHAECLKAEASRKK